MTLDYVFETCTGHKPEYFLERGELDWYEGYAADNRECKPKGLLVANWNNFPHGGRQRVEGKGYPDTIVTPTGLKHNGTTSEAMHRFEDILEKLGYELDWLDEISRCDDCGRAIHTTPDCFFWTPDYVTLKSGGDICEKCVRKDPLDYLEECAKKREACQWPDLDFKSVDYYPVAMEYPVDAKPHEIYKALRNTGRGDYLVVDTKQSDVVKIYVAYERVY